MSDSVRSHKRQATRLRHPWDSPGKNTAVGCHFLLQCMQGKSEREVAQSCPTLRDPMDCSLPGSSIHGIFQARVLEWVAITVSIEEGYCWANSFYQFITCQEYLGKKMMPMYWEVFLEYWISSYLQSIPPKFFSQKWFLKQEKNIT